MRPDLPAGINVRAATTVLFCIFLAWFSMTFYMDNSNDSETDAYARSLIASANQLSISVDATGHPTLLAQYVLWPLAAAFERVSGIYTIRAFVVVRFLVGLLLFSAAYAWFRQLGLAWFTALLGLSLLSVCLAFALLSRGWELDKVIEPALFLMAALAAWSRRHVALVVLTALAVANRETGVFVVALALSALAHDEQGILAALRRWPVWACLGVALAIVVPLRALAPQTTWSPLTLLGANLQLDRLVYVVGGLCLLPLLALAWVRSAPEALQRLFWLLAPAWLAFVLFTDRLEQGAVLLAPTALVFLPVVLGAVEQRAAARVPAGPAAR
jgi:hypothetical protein